MGTLKDELVAKGLATEADIKRLQQEDRQIAKKTKREMRHWAHKLEVDRQRELRAEKRSR